MTDWFTSEDKPAGNNLDRELARQGREDNEIWQRLMKEKNGRSLIYRLLADHCHVFDTSFRPSAPEDTFFRMGEEYIGKKLHAQVIAASPELYLTMMAEGKQNDERLAALKKADQRERSENPIPPDDALPPPGGFTKP